MTTSLSLYPTNAQLCEWVLARLCVCVVTLLQLNGSCFPPHSLSLLPFPFPHRALVLSFHEQLFLMRKALCKHWKRVYSSRSLCMKSLCAGCQFRLAHIQRAGTWPHQTVCFESQRCSSTHSTCAGWNLSGVSRTVRASKYQHLDHGADNKSFIIYIKSDGDTGDRSWLKEFSTHLMQQKTFHTLHLFFGNLVNVFVLTSHHHHFTSTLILST